MLRYAPGCGNGFTGNNTPSKVAPLSAKRPLTQRSAVTNGRTLIAGIDGRSVWYRRFRDLCEAIISDLGGDDRISEAERLIARRAATLAVECERMEAGFATAGMASAIELDLYGRTANSLRRLLESTGLERRPRDITPALSDYIAARAPAKAAAHEAAAVPAPKQPTKPPDALAPMPPPPAPIIAKVDP